MVLGVTLAAFRDVAGFRERITAAVAINRRAYLDSPHHASVARRPSPVPGSSVARRPPPAARLLHALEPNDIVARLPVLGVLEIAHAHNHPVAATFIKQAARRGTKLIVVDVPQTDADWRRRPRGR